VRGNFTGDASGNAVAFTSGAKGWGAIKAESNENIGPSGQPVGANLIDLSYDSTSSTETSRLRTARSNCP